MAGVSWVQEISSSLGLRHPMHTPLLALESVLGKDGLQGLADTDVADDVVGLAMQGFQGGPGLFDGRGAQRP